jgi:hypothetical protein
LRGIREILSTISNFSKRIPIGADTEKVNAMTRIFMNNTIVARVEDGRKDSRVAPLLQPNQGYRDLLLLKWPRVRDRDLLLLAWRRRDRLLPRVRNRDRLLPRVRNRDRLLPRVRNRDRLLPRVRNRNRPLPRVRNRNRLLLKKHLGVNLKRKNISRPRRKGGTPFEVRAVALFRAAENAPQIACLRRLT